MHSTKQQPPGEPEAAVTVAVKAASALPIIDVSPWIEGHDHKGRLSTAAAIHAACLEFGFFYLDVSAFVSPDEPEELSRLAREFFGLPRVKPVQEELLKEVQERLRANIKAMDPEAMLKTWLPATIQGFEQLQEMFLRQMSRASDKRK